MLDAPCWDGFPGYPGHQGRYRQGEGSVGPVVVVCFCGCLSRYSERHDSTAFCHWQPVRHPPRNSPSALPGFSDGQRFPQDLAHPASQTETIRTTASAEMGRIAGDPQDHRSFCETRKATWQPGRTRGSAPAARAGLPEAGSREFRPSPSQILEQLAGFAGDAVPRARAWRPETEGTPTPAPPLRRGARPPPAGSCLSPRSGRAGGPAAATRPGAPPRRRPGSPLPRPSGGRGRPGGRPG